MQLQIANSIGVSVGIWIPKICVIDLHVIASRPIWRPHASFHSLLGRLCLDFLLDMSPAARPHNGSLLWLADQIFMPSVTPVFVQAIPTPEPIFDSFDN
ncbi:Methionine aminopeptidase 2-1 [Fusarium oxysporum f. sp. albedinis]|nr:Methionine aminopeptidase 2-1 [Fusarium oxysporum f. sp. albedinis]